MNINQQIQWLRSDNDNWEKFGENREIIEDYEEWPEITITARNQDDDEEEIDQTDSTYDIQFFLPKAFGEHVAEIAMGLVSGAAKITLDIVYPEDGDDLPYGVYYDFSDLSSLEAYSALAEHAAGLEGSPWGGLTTLRFLMEMGVAHDSVESVRYFDELIRDIIALPDFIERTNDPKQAIWDIVLNSHTVVQVGDTIYLVCT